MTRMRHWILTGVLLAAMLPPAQEALAWYQNSMTLSAGIYSASGFGANPYIAGRYNYFLPGNKFFVEAAVGFTSLKSNVLESVARSQVFESTDLWTYEFALAYDPTPTGYIPYIIGGVAGLNQGGQSTFSGVIGLGKRIPLGGAFGSSPFALRYDVRDQIFSQQINNAEPFVSHNIQFSLGIQYYF